MTNSKRPLITPDRLNLIIAICAILISGASFYATYLQAISAERQVQAMTFPLLQFAHDNYDQDQNLRAIDFKLRNTGVGPAVIHTIEIGYLDREYSNLTDLFISCCESEYQDYQSALKDISLEKFDASQGGMVVDSLRNVTLAGQSEYLFLRLYHGQLNSSFWERLDKERFRMTLKTCYCTLLGECFVNVGNIELNEVSSCPAQ